MNNTIKSWSDFDSAPNQRDLAVVIGRFQPLHKGHIQLIQSAYRYSKNVLVLVGSSYIAPTTKNPFSYELRRDMIKSEFPNVEVRPVVDDLYNDQQWIASVHSAVEEFNPNSVCLIGHKKDQSSWYLDAFPKWEYIETSPLKDCDGTEIRNTLFGIIAFNKAVSDAVKKVIVSWRDQNSEEFQRLVDEYHFLKKYRAQFSALPYPPIFVTTDAVVINNGYILLVRRGAQPGKGLWALPGGFVNHDERVENSMLRELKEETRIKVNDRVLKAALRSTHVFDAPGRSLRGRTITHAGLFVLNEFELPQVRGSDDADKARWMPISEFYSLETRQKMYEDHWSIGSYMINRAG